MSIDKKVRYTEVGGWDVSTTITHHDDGHDTTDTERIMMCTLLVIRDELKKLNRLLYCQNFIDIPRKLDAIRRNTQAKNKKPRKPK